MLSLSGQNLTVDPNEFNYLAVGESVVITYSYDVADGQYSHHHHHHHHRQYTASDADSDQLSVSNQSASAVDGNGSTISIPSAATITITGANDAPVVAAITSNKTEDDSSYSIDLLGTASDADNSDQLSVSNQSASAVDGNGSTISIPSGALSLSGQNLTVDPNEFNYLAVGESVVITYSYDVADGTTTTANTATITITGANDAPVVSAITSNKTEDDSSYSIDLLGTASDADNSDQLSVSNQSASAVDGNGSTISIPSAALSLSGQNLTVDPNEFNYLAVGESVVITCSYDVADGTTTTRQYTGAHHHHHRRQRCSGGPPPPTVHHLQQNRGRFQLLHRSPRHAPVVSAITSNKTRLIDADNSDQLSVSNQSASAVDGNGSTISIPSAALSLSGQNLTVDPNEFNYLAVGESVVITYSYDVADGTTTTANTATITITGANDAPVVSAITSNKTEDDSSYSIDLLGTASDADNSDQLSVSNQSASAVDGNGSTISIPSGALSLSGQNLTVDPNEFNYLAVGESVVITYSYDVVDGTTTTANTATITITGANDAPVVSAITSQQNRGRFQLLHRSPRHRLRRR